MNEIVPVHTPEVLLLECPPSPSGRHEPVPVKFRPRYDSLGTRIIEMYATHWACTRCQKLLDLDLAHLVMHE